MKNKNNYFENQNNQLNGERNNKQYQKQDNERNYKPYNEQTYNLDNERNNKPYQNLDNRRNYKQDNERNYKPYNEQTYNLDNERNNKPYQNLDNRRNYKQDNERNYNLNNKPTINSIKNAKISYRLWCIKITIITMCLAGLFSFVSELTSSITSIVATIFLLLFLIVLSIIFDGIAVAVTSCDKESFIRFAKGSASQYTKIGLLLLDNQDRVANICADVIGDIFSIVSGSCSVAIVMELIITFPNMHEQILTIAFSSVVAGITVGGKAFMKKIAIKSCNSYVLLTSKIIALFVRSKDDIRKNKRTKRFEKVKRR